MDLPDEAEGLDGEIIVFHPNGEMMNFNEIQSIIMTEYTAPFLWRFFVFDVAMDNDLTYMQRVVYYTNIIRHHRLPFCVEVEPNLVRSLQQLQAEFKGAVRRGYEGLIVRDEDAPYKAGRCTFNSQAMLKLKQHADNEGQVIGYQEAKANHNPPLQSRTGHTKRSSHKANKKPKNTLGAFIVNTEEFGEIKVSPGPLTQAQKQQIWDNQADYMDQTLTYTYHSYGIKEKPRSAVFKGWCKDK
jgi:DNA ligase-1